MPTSNLNQKPDFPCSCFKTSLPLQTSRPLSRPRDSASLKSLFHLWHFITASDVLCSTHSVPGIFCRHSPPLWSFLHMLLYLFWNIISFIPLPSIIPKLFSDSSLSVTNVNAKPICDLTSVFSYRTPALGCQSQHVGALGPSNRLLEICLLMAWFMLPPPSGVPSPPWALVNTYHYLKIYLASWGITAAIFPQPIFVLITCYFKLMPFLVDCKLLEGEAS